MTPDSPPDRTRPSSSQGPARVGRISAECTDPDRSDPYADDPATRRQLLLWIWYPAEPSSSAQPADYLPAAWTPIADQLGIDVSGLHTHAVADAPAADRRSPVLILSPSGFSPLCTAAIAEELASHGYVIVGVNHTFETAVTVFADGHVATLNPAALGGALGPQTGPHEDAFRRRAAVCSFKAVDLRFVADQLDRIAPNPLVWVQSTSTSRASERSDTPSEATPRSSGVAPIHAAGQQRTWTAPSGPKSARWASPGLLSRSSPTTRSSPCRAPTRSRPGSPPTRHGTRPRGRWPGTAGAPSTAWRARVTPSASPDRAT